LDKTTPNGDDNHAYGSYVFSSSGDRETRTWCRESAKTISESTELPRRFW